MLIVTTENNVYVNVTKVTFNSFFGIEITLHYEDGARHTVSAHNIKSIEADK